MIASEVKIRPQTVNYYDKPLTFKQKRNLRLEIIKQVITSKPAGSRIETREFAKALAMNEAATYSYVNTLVKKGAIGRTSITPRTYSYFTYDAVTKKASKQVQPTPPQHIRFTDRSCKRVCLAVQLRLTTRICEVAGG